MILGLGVPEVLIILVIVLLIFGPKNLPKLGSALGKTVKSVREGMEDESDDKDAKKVEESSEAADTSDDVVDVEPAGEDADLPEDADANAASTDDAVFCSKCGTKNPKGAAFCSKCGNQLQA